MDDELERFKVEIDLREYLEAQGYVLDRRKSWRGSSVMRHPLSDDKVSVSRKGDHWVFYSFRTQLSGSVIDACRHLHGGKINLGKVRILLRPFLGLPQKASSSLPPLEEIKKDRAKVEAKFALTRVATRHPFLENERGIPARLLEDPRFRGTVRIDVRGNAVFPHVDRNGDLVGFELKNVGGFTGFSPGGMKGLWLSNKTENDNRLVILESSIDALSYAAIFGNTERTRYASVGGNVSPAQKEQIRCIISSMQQSKIVAAFDADAAGTKLSDMVREIVQLVGRDDLSFVLQKPAGYKDWNDQLSWEAENGRPHSATGAFRRVRTSWATTTQHSRSTTA